MRGQLDRTSLCAHLKTTVIKQASFTDSNYILLATIMDCVVLHYLQGTVIITAYCLYFVVFRLGLGM